MRGGLLLSLGVLAMLFLGAALPSTRAQTELVANLRGPDGVAPGSLNSYFVNATGGPGSEIGGNFSVRFYITGADLAGGLPLETAPRTEFGGTGPFRLNITAPTRETLITLVALVNSSNGPDFEATTLTKAITVITPIVLTARFVNNGAAAATNVPVKFYVDGTFVGYANLTRIEPGATGTATFKYFPIRLALGQHSVRAEADLNRNGVIEQDKGEVAILDVFHKKELDLSWGVTITIVAAIVSVTFLVVRALRRRRR